LSGLYFYTIFHANLAFSSIPSDQYSVILDKCYWPLLELTAKGYKLGIEFSASTLSAIDKLDKSFICELKKLWDSGKCEVIGSAGIQNIFPLIPHEVNRLNFANGKKTYFKILNRFPEIGFVNEQTYSKGLPEFFADAGYKAIVMDWDNASEFNEYPPDLRYKPALAKGVDGFRMPVIWNSSLNSFKFQRCIYNRISIDDFVSSVIAHRHPEQDRALILYGTDWEIFDYRPGTQEEINGEISKIERLLKKLLSNPDVELVTPSEILNLFKPEDEVNIESTQCPIPCKNRDDYNVLRWAVSGRDNVSINTECYRIYNKLKNLDFFNGMAGNSKELWKDLNDLWSSDLRTKTTDEKHYEAKLKIGEVSRTIDRKAQAVYEQFNPVYDFILINPFPEDWNYEPYSFEISFNPGEKFGELCIEIDDKLVLSQCEHTEFYRDTSLRRVKLTVCPFIKSGYIAQGRIISLENSKDNRFKKYNGDNLKIETESVKLNLASDTGGDIRELIFPKVDKKPLIGYLPPVYYDHIGHSSDYYSGGISVCDSFGRIFNDTVQTDLYLPENPDNYPIRVPVKCKINIGSGIFWKTYYVYRDFARADLLYHFYLPDLNPIFFRVGVTTLNPEAFDKETLRFSTVNGSDKIEEFFTAGKTVRHISPVGSFSSANTCLGATEGWVDISDGKKHITVCTDKSILYSVPMIEYEEVKKSYLMRIHHTISESDETGRMHWRGHNNIMFSYFGHKSDLNNVRTMINHLSRNLIFIPRKKKADSEHIFDNSELLEQVNYIAG